MYRIQTLFLLVGISCFNISGAALPQMEFVSIPAGEYIMGTADLDDARIEMPPGSQPGITDEQPAHKVKLSAFNIGKYEITQQQWFEVMASRPGPESYWRRPDWKQLPVVSVSWYDTQDFINKLNTLDSKHYYRLPSEAEWEYVAREGNNELRPFPVEDMDEHAWSITNSSDVPHAVGQLNANHFGVHDMFGNAWEWVHDWYQPAAYSTHADANPQGPRKGNKKVRRGGSYHCAMHFVRSGYRAADLPTQRYSVLGFRLVRETKAD